MKIKMLVGFAGHGFVLDPGQEYERPESEALRMIERGQAVPVREAVIETEESSAPKIAEKAAARTRKK